MHDTTKTIVLAALNQAFPSFPSTIQESPEDTATLLVRVFAVPVDQVRAVKDFIHDLEDNLPATARAMLLPMVKNLEATKQYYPEYVSPEPDVAASGGMWFMSVPAPQYLVSQTTTRSTSYTCDYRLAQTHWVFDSYRITGEQFKPAPRYENRVAANEDLALAA